MKKFFLIFINLILLAPFFVFGQVKNQNLINQNNSECVFDSKIEELKSISEDQNLDYLIRYNKEIELRKEILLNIFKCLISESKNYISVLEKMNITKPAVVDMRIKLINELNKTIDYYEFRKAQVYNLSLDGLKYTAKSLKEDRESRFIPLNQKINDFILWNKNEELFNTAKNRISDVEKVIKIFKPEDNQEIRDLLNDILNKLELALNKHNEAWNAIDLSTDKKSSILIQESLSELLNVYNLLYDLSKKTIALMGITK